MNAEACHGARGERRESRGFSIVELMFAVLILFVVSTSVLGALNYAARSSRNSQTRSSALNLANQRLEQIRNLPYDNVGVRYAGGGYGNPAGSVLTPESVDDRFNVDTSVTWARDAETHRALYKRVTVTVTWDESLSDGSVSVSSNVFGKSALVNTGDISIDVRDLATDEHLDGAWVTLTPSTGITRQVRTGADGEAFFGYVSSGDYAITITKDGFLFDPDRLSTVHVSPDLLTSLIAYGQQPSTIVTTVTDADGTPISGAAVTLTRTSGAVQTETTDGTGKASFEGLFVDMYEAAASATGRAPDQETVNVSQGGQEYAVTLVLVQRFGLTVRTVSSDGEVIPGVTVNVLGPAPVLTDADGSPSVSGATGEASFDSLLDGTYTIVASKAGYGAETTTIAYSSAAAMDPVVLTMSPVTYGDLEIHTIDNRGRRNSNERCTVTGPGGYFVTIRTDWNGYYLLTGLPAGQYTVRSQDGGQGSQKTVSVQAGQTSVVEVVSR